jgi:D-alanine-D-alanine ligase
MKKIRVAVLFGGRSNEHSISIASAAGVITAIDKNKYEVIPVGITKEGVFVKVSEDPENLKLSKGLKTITNTGITYSFAMDGSKELFEVDGNGNRSSVGVIDVVFPVLHGPFGEDGTIQGYLELVGVSYVGNGVLASAVAMDKQFSKALFKASGLDTPNSVVVRKSEMISNPESALERISTLDSYPLYVKPARAGSSVGISKVSSANELPEALELAFEHDEKAIIEVGVVGREIECGVLETPDGNLEVSVAGEIKVKDGAFYDFDAKYLHSDKATLICPAELNDEQIFEMKALAKKAFRALGCRGLARVDFFLTKQGFVLNEINTMPGFTSISMYPRCFEASGVSYGDLVGRLIQLALSR